MPWVRVENGFPEDPKTIQAGERAGWLYIAALCYASRQETDGMIAKDVVPRLIRARDARKLAQKLVEVGLWLETPGGYEIKNYLEYQTSKAEIHKRRAQTKERMQRLRAHNKSTSSAPTEHERASDAGSDAGSDASIEIETETEIETSSSSSTDLGKWLARKGLEQKYIDHALDVLDRNSNQVQNERAYVLKCAQDRKREDEDEGAKREQAAKNAEIVKRTREQEEAGATRAPQSQQSQPPKTTPEKAKNSASRTQARTSMRKQSESEEAERARQLRELEAWNPDPPTSPKEAEAIVRKKVV